jgi:hypothetical protein
MSIFVVIKGRQYEHSAICKSSRPHSIEILFVSSLMMEISHGGCFDSLATLTVTICSDVRTIALGSHTETWITLVRDLGANIWNSRSF